jgi:outer membrane protein OmpA-like peptidoglycan-associated protein
MNKDEVLLEEGWKEVLLGTLLLMGVGLNKSNAQDAKKIIDNQEVLNQIENTFNNGNLKPLIDKMESVGINNPKEKIKKNINLFHNNFNKVSKDKKLDLKLITKNVDNLDDVEKLINRGYSVSDVSITSDTILPKGDIVLSEIINDLEFSSDLFKTGDYEINDSIKNNINNYINNVKELGGVITNINIESSTDTEPISIGNEKLAQLRANNIAQLFNNDSTQINIKTLPNNGPDVYSKSMTPKERVNTRKETAEYRYIKIKITTLVPAISLGNETAPQLMDKISINLIKPIIKGDTKEKIKDKGKKIKCKVIKHKGKKMKCPKF